MQPTVFTLSFVHYRKSLTKQEPLPCSAQFLGLICHEMSPSQMKEWDLSQLREVLTCPFKWSKGAFHSESVQDFVDATLVPCNL